MMIVVALALAGCGGNEANGGGGADMAAGGGNDMQMVVTTTTTIAQARMGNVMTPITVKGVVTVVAGDDPADTKEWYIQDPAGGPYSGVSVYCNKTAKSNPCPMTLTPPALHDLVQVTGKLSTYKGKVELQPTAEMTMMQNATPPPVMTASASDVASGSTNAAIRGALVKLTGTFTVDSVTPQACYDTQCGGDAGTNGLCTGCKPPTYSGFQVSDGSGHEILVENTFYLSEHLTSSPECVSMAATGTAVTMGKTFSMISGIVDADPYGPMGTVAISPTADSDYTLQ
jgi:predicted extracellular nuclease